MEIASLILGIVSVIGGFVPIFNIILLIPAIIGLILGIVARAKRKKEQNKSKGMDIIGIIFNAIALVVILGSLIFSFFALIFGFAEQKNLTEKKEEIQTKQQTEIYTDLISGKNWRLPDSSYLELKSGNTYYWYKSQYDLTDNYHMGTYQVYQAEDAIEYIANDLSEYGLTEQEQKDIIARNEEYRIENYYCLVLNNQRSKIDGEAKTSSGRNIYWGFYENKAGQEYLDFANMNTASYSTFTRVK